MSGNWIIAIIILLGFVALALGERGVDVSFAPPGFGQRSSLEAPVDLNGDGIIDEEERRQASLINVQSELRQIEREVAQAEEEALASPYKGVVTLRRGSASSNNVADEYVEISVSSRAKQNIVLTGWQLISPISGVWATIGRGATVLNQGEVNKTDTIVLGPGERAIVATRLSPLGVSFRTNSCIGYIGQHQRFSPRLRSSCPAADDENLQQFGISRTDDACIDYLERAPQCSIVRSNDDLTDECNVFIRTYLNYNGCVELHRGDIDFLGDEWRIFMNHPEPLWRTKREVIKLLDSAGKTVDVVNY